jgi:hypothetical protein
LTTIVKRSGKGKGEADECLPSWPSRNRSKDDESTTQSQIEKRGGKDGKRKQAREPRPEQAVCFEFGFILELPETNTTSELLGEDGMVWRPEKSGLDGERGEGGNCCLAAWVIGHLE